MQTAQAGDRVQVHYVKRFQDGSVVSSHSREPLELTVGHAHPRLPGLGLALVGLAPGASATVAVSVENAYGATDPQRIRYWPRTRFGPEPLGKLGKWVRIANSRGQSRFVRILEVRGAGVVVDTNHRRSGQTLMLEVELIAVNAAL